MPYSFASLRTIRNGRPDESDAAAASATAPSSGPASRTASGSCSAHGGRDVLAERGQQLRPRLEAVLVEVVARAAARAEDEVALEVGVLAERGAELVALHGRGGAQRVARVERAAGPPRASRCASETSEPSAK